MMCIFVGIICLTLSTATASGIHFDKDTLSRRVCFYGDETYPRIIDQTSTRDGDVPVTYFLTGSAGFMSINSSTGFIYLDGSLEHNVSQTAVTVKKHAQDIGGKEAVVSIAFTWREGREFAERCPKTLYFDVRQIAPVGEEIGNVECRERTHFNGSTVKTHFKKVLVSEGKYAPFDITPEGVVVVSDRLVFYNSISDITIFNVKITSDVMYDGIDNCTRITTRVTTVITVKETGCQDNWTYSLTQNLFIDVTPLAVILPSSIDACMRNCTSWTSSQCNSFVFNVLTNKCFILNDTDRTLPNKTMPRMGYLYYRKQCETASLPALPLRNLAKKINKVKTLEGRIELVKELMDVQERLKNNTSDVVIAIELLGDIVNAPEMTPPEDGSIRNYIQTIKTCFEVFLSFTGSMPFQPKDNLRLLEIFDDIVTFISSLTFVNNARLVVPGNVTSLQLVNTSVTAVSTNPILLHVIDGHSGVTLRQFPTDCQVGVGILTTISGLILPEWSINSSIETDGNTSMYYLTSHVVSVSSNPYPNSSFQIQLDIYTEEVTDSQESQRICAFIFSDESQSFPSVWGTEGCLLLGHNQTHTRCTCTHLTNFAVLMQVRNFRLSVGHKVSLEVVTMVGCCVSIAALTTTLLVLLWLRLQSDRYVLLLNLTFALILAQAVFLTGIDAVKNKVICRCIAISLHYLYLTVFTMMLAQGVHLYHKLYRAFEADSNLSMFLLLGWGSPCVIIAISVVTNLEGYGNEERCWLSTDGPVWAFVGPALTVISINMAILVMIIRTFLGVRFNANKTDVEKFKASVRATVVLLPLLGVTWMFGVVAVNGSTVVFQYIFAILNSLQGLFIFLCHVVFNEEVREACGKYKGRIVTLLTHTDITQEVAAPERLASYKSNLYRKRSSQKSMDHREK